MTEEVKEIAKAVTETAKLGNQSVKTTEKILTFIAKVFNEPAIEAAGIATDWLKVFRWKRLVVYSDQVNAILTQRGVKETQSVPPKLALPILENATLEEDDELQALWATLMANAMDPSFKTELRMAYIDIIKSLNPLDVRLLKTFYEALKENPEVDWNNITKSTLAKEVICKKMGISEQDYELTVFNLFRVQCLAPAILNVGGIFFGGEPATTSKGSQVITMTPLGVKFVESCVQK